MDVGPFTTLQMSMIVSLNGFFALTISDGLVVTPSRIPSAWPSRISEISAVSRKNCMKHVLSDQSLVFVDEPGCRKLDIMVAATRDESLKTKSLVADAVAE